MTSNAWQSNLMSGRNLSHIALRFIPLMLLWPTPSLIAQSPMRQHQLDSVAVVGHHYASPIRGLGTGAIRWQMEHLVSMPQILGNADPLRYAQMLPGVQTNADLDAGMHIMGCDNGHNELSIDGIPVFNPTHLLGFFSAFSATHFAQMELTPSANRATMANRLGGFIDMQSHTTADSLSGHFTTGLIATDATLRLPTGSRSALTASARTSYLNLLYGPFLKVDDSQMRYDFSDLNLSWSFAPTQADQLLLTAYAGGDDLSIDDLTSNAISWGNRLIGVTWRHALAEGSLQMQAYASHYHNRLQLDASAFRLDVRSQITDLGANAALQLGEWDLRLDYIHHSLSPLPWTHQHAHEATLAAHWQHHFTPQLSLGLGLKGSLYALNGEASWQRLDPMATLQYQTLSAGTLTLTCSSRHQFLQQSSISQLGLPTEFWYSATPTLRPQYAHSLTLGHHWSLPAQGWQLSTQLFGKRLSHQKEFVGTAMNFVTEVEFDFFSQLSEGRGHNYGIDLILHKTSGRLTGWVAFTLSRALRRFSSIPHTFPASHERRFEGNIVANYRLNDKLDLAATFVLADGVPFTAPDYFLLLNGRFLSHFARYNDNRLPTYHRLDLALHWHLSSRQSLNLSLYNAYGHDNVTHYRLKLHQGRYGYRPLCLFSWPLPSVAYTLRF